MSAALANLNRAVAAFLLLCLFSAPGASPAQDRAAIDSLFARLKQADPGEAKRIGAEIRMEMAKSGSAAMDLLLKRGREALESGDTGAAIEHLTALTDHAPRFAEGWHMRSVAYARAELYGPALTDIERALALNPRHFPAIYGLGSILQEVGKPELAREAFLRVAEIHPHFEDVATKLDSLGGQVDGTDL